MAQQVIDIGNGANDGTGDTISVAGAKINNNFSDVYDFDVVNSDISFLDNTIRTKSSNADLVLLASGTGSIVFPAIRINDNNIEATRTNDDIRIIPHGTGKVTIANVGFSAGTTISSDDSSLININENLNVDGTLNVEGTLTSSGTISGGTGSTIGTLTLANGSITDSSGAISFGN